MLRTRKLIRDRHKRRECEASVMLKLNYTRRGSGAPLLLIHGTGSHWPVWQPVLNRLAHERDVIAVDLPGHGGSPLLPPDLPPTPTTFAGVLAGFLKELGLASAHLAGNSVGGWTALEMAKNGHARSVTALSPAGLWRDQSPLYDRAYFRISLVLARLLRNAIPLITATGPGRRSFLGIVTAHSWQMSSEDAADMITNFARSPGILPHLRATERERFTGGQGITVPVTVAWGARDRLLLPWQSRRHEELPSQTRWLTLPGCGHVPTYDDPALVARVLLEGSNVA